MNVLLVSFLGVIMLFAAFLAVYAKRLVVAIVASGVISLFASVIYLILAAPDVAMTEAAIGSALTTVVFLLAIRAIGGKKEVRDD
ncbi:DUF4040 domain-containing protein [bacterium]|nr:DUF4040 domain-containing protein [bacterium]